MAYPRRCISRATQHPVEYGVTTITAFLLDDMLAFGMVLCVVLVKVSVRCVELYSLFVLLAIFNFGAGTLPVRIRIYRHCSVSVL